jgi:hypothetical protein
VILSCSLVIAGTCDVGFLRLTRYCRRRNITTSFPQYVYGLHQVLGMAIGVINLGKGRYTLGLSNAATAAILIAILPRFSRSPTDNDFMVQSLRHLLAAAVIPRVLETRDVDTQEIVSLYVRVGLTDGNELAFKTPHVLPPYDEITSLKIDDSEYFGVNLTVFPYRDDKVRPIIWLKKRSAKLQSEIGTVETLRTIFNMKANKLFAMDGELSQQEDIMKTKLELEWDAVAHNILEFLRCESVADRTRLLAGQPAIDGFLAFHGLLPSASLQDIASFSADAVAFLVPHISADELALLSQ